MCNCVKNKKREPEREVDPGDFLTSTYLAVIRKHGSLVMQMMH